MKNYPERYNELRITSHELGERAPELLANFGTLHKNTMQDGVLSTKIKELIALGMAITARCDGCIAYHVRDALIAGATEEEIIETLGVAVLMGGGPSLIYSEEAFVAMKQFENYEKELINN